MGRITAILLLLLLSLPAYAQDDRIDPRHPDAVEFPEFGRMVGTISKTVSTQGRGEQFGYVIEPVGDVNHDGLQDWVVGHNRIDSLYTAFDLTHSPIEILLYKGMNGGIPSVESGVRVGPTELFCETEFLGAADFDGDRNRDIVVCARFWNDTSFNNSTGRQLRYVIVYWGNNSGTYSNDDTTRLPSTGNTWLGLATGTAGDVTGDGIDDLVVYFKQGISWGVGETVPDPRMHVFVGGTGQRWGRNGVSAQARLRWWAEKTDFSTPELQILDHDQDGLNDLVVFDQVRNTSSGESRITIFYARAGRELPDTLDMERIELTIANGKTVQLRDITGDGAPEIVMSSGSEETFKVFAGRPGQRIAAQYAYGYNPPIEGQGWWTRPWHVIKQPYLLHDGWYMVEQMAVADLGDGNLDGIADIWSYSAPFLICYTTGEYLDQWIDGYIRVYNLFAVANLGDIDGSGAQTIALHYDQVPRRPLTPFPGGIVFIKQNRSLPTKNLEPALRLPHLPPVAGVEEVESSGEDILVRREEGGIRVRLLRGEVGKEYAVEIFDRIGERVGRVSLRVGGGEVVQLGRGVYFVRVAGRVSRVVL